VGAADPGVAARNAERVRKIADAGMTLELDAVARRLPPEELEKFGGAVKAALDQPTPQAKASLNKLIRATTGSVKP
jgi:hypothetical protein